MKLVENWREILTKSHSMWAVYFGGGVMVTPELIYQFTQTDTDPRLWFVTGVLCLIYGGIGRIFKQAGVTDAKVQSPWFVGLGLLALLAFPVLSDMRLAEPVPVPVVDAGLTSIDGDVAFLDRAVPFVSRWEGLETIAYLDLVGVPTVCFGETKGVRLGDRYTVAECEAMLARELLEYRAGLHLYFEATARDKLLPVPRDVSFVSLAYNVGVAGAGKSTAVRRLNAGDVAGACEALTWWNKAGGRVIRGLVNRRSDERALCLQGLS